MRGNAVPEGGPDRAAPETALALELSYCSGVFHHIAPAQLPAALAAIRRALCPGGYLALWENNPWNPGTRYVMSCIPFDRDASSLAARAARRMLTAAGFSVIRTDFLFIFPRALRGLRAVEPLLSRPPLSTQYQVLCRR